MCSCDDNSHWHGHGFREIIKRRCHSCKCEIDEELSVPCRGENCHLFFCQKCLTSRYKYSKVKAASLPSLNWRCPVCTRRCFCEDCASSGNLPRRRKQLAKRNLYTIRRRPKKRPRCTLALSLTSSRSQEGAGQATHNGSCCASPEAPAPISSPPAVPALGALSPEFSFARALAAKDLESASVRRQACMMPITVGKRMAMLSAETYSGMTAVECLQLAFAPFYCAHN